MQHRFIRTVLGSGLAVIAAQSAASAQIAINEIYASHTNPSADTYEYIELKGPAGQVLDNFVVCIVEGEGTTTNQGTLDRAWDLTGYSIPLDGYFVLGDTAETALDYNIGVQDRIENGTETFYLIDAGNPANVAAIVALLATDVDPDGDFITTLPTFGTIVDIIAMVDAGYPATDSIYDGAAALGPQGTNFPGGVFRGLDAPNPWCADFLDFDAGMNLIEPRTPGAVNSVCPSAATPIVNYCTAGTTTSGCNAQMQYTGLPTASATSGFTVTCAAYEGNNTGIIFYGLTPLASAWGTSSSFLCVKSPLERTGIQAASGTVGNCDASMSIDFLAYVAANPSAVGVPFSAGNKVYFQGWFRDPPSPKTSMLSDGLDVTMMP